MTKTRNALKKASSSKSVEAPVPELLSRKECLAAGKAGLRVQACGNCHLLNFGVFATPERNLVFDMNDFDETLPAPWE